MSVSETDTNGDGMLDFIVTITYDANGNIRTSASEIDTNGDGVLDEKTKDTYTQFPIADGLEILFEQQRS